MTENGSIPISDGSDENGVGFEAAAEPQTEPPPRQPRAERTPAFTFSTWLLEGMVGLCEELQHNDLGLPPAFWTHAYAARREGAVGLPCAGRRRTGALRGGCGAAERKTRQPARPG